MMATLHSSSSSFQQNTPTMAHVTPDVSVDFIQPKLKGNLVIYKTKLLL